MLLSSSQAHLTRLNANKLKAAVPVSQLHPLDRLPLQSPQPNDLVAALYDLNFDLKPSQRSASPKWSDFYYLARVSPDQTGVPAGSTRVVYDDDGKTAVVPAEARCENADRLLPAIIQVRRSQPGARLRLLSRASRRVQR